MKKTATRDMCEVAALIALTIILSHFASIETDAIRIGFGFVPIALCGMLFGPVWAGVAYGIADMAGALLFYGYITPGITLSAILTGVFFGLFLHRDAVKLPHIIGAVLSNQLICSLFVTTVALSLTYGQPFWATFISRIPQVGLTIVAQFVIIPVLMQIRRALLKANLVSPVRG